MYADDLDGYDGESVQYIVAVLRERYPHNTSHYARPRPHAGDHPQRQNASTQTHLNNSNNNTNTNTNDGRLTASSSSALSAADAGRSRHSVTIATPDVATGDDDRGFFDAAEHDDVVIVAEEYANVTGPWTTDAVGGPIPPNSSGTETKSNNRSSAVPPPSHFENHSYSERMLEIAHIFHFVSIAILGIFVIQVRRPRALSI